MALGTAAVIDYRLLGPAEVGVNGHALDLGGQKLRALLVILLLSANEPVSRDVLVDRLWGEHPPAGAQHTLEVYISRLRKTLEPAAGGQVVLTRSSRSRRWRSHGWKSCGPVSSRTGSKPISLSAVTGTLSVSWKHSLPRTRCASGFASN